MSFIAFPSGPGPQAHNIQIRMTQQSPTFQQHQFQTPLESPNYNPTSGGYTMNSSAAAPPGGPGSYQQIPEPKKYTGGNIPSRSFKILQAMTPNDGKFVQNSKNGFFGLIWLF